MISDKVLGAYAAVGALSPSEQAEWYTKACSEWNIDTFEIPLLGGVPLAPELVEALAAGSASLVVTMVAQWATKGQENPGYGLSSLDEGLRREALLDVQSAIEAVPGPSATRGIGIRALELHTGRRTGSAVAHAVFLRAESAGARGGGGRGPAGMRADRRGDRQSAARAPHRVSREPRRRPCKQEELIEAVAEVNKALPGRPISLVLNWGRLLINGDRPLEVVEQVLESRAPLGGVILSGANPTPDGFADAHNSHLDPGSGFTAADGRACAEALQAADDSCFIGMKCGVTSSAGELTPEQVLAAEAGVSRQRVGCNCAGPSLRTAESNSCFPPAAGGWSMRGPTPR